MAPGSRYLALSELVELAIARGVLANWDALVLMGIPADYVKAIKSTNVGFQKDSSN